MYTDITQVHMYMAIYNFTYVPVGTFCDVIFNYSITMQKHVNNLMANKEQKRWYNLIQ